MKAPEKTGTKQSKNSKFAKGQSGNPAGRPKGARNKTTLAVEALLDGEAAKLTKKAIERALAGDVTALRLCLDRISPPSRERRVSFTLPRLESADDLPDASAAIIHAVANGEVGLAEGEAILRMMDCFRRAFDSAEIERRLLALEAAHVESR